MRAREVAVVVALLALGAVALTVPTVSVGVDTVSAPQADNATETNETNNEIDFGTQVSSFTQTTAADTNHTIDSGMWNASVAMSDTPATEVEDRTATLEQRLDNLQERTADLAAQRDNLSESSYQTQASALRAEIANVRRAINETEQTAERVGVDAETLDTLRSDASNMTGPEVSAPARNITDAPRGPPDHAGPGEQGLPDDVGPDNGTGEGPPDDRGPGDEAGPPDDRGDGTGDDDSDDDSSGPPADSDDDGDETDGDTDDDDTESDDDDDNDGAGPDGDGPPGQSSGFI